MNRLLDVREFFFAKVAHSDSHFSTGSLSVYLYSHSTDTVKSSFYNKYKFSGVAKFCEMIKQLDQFLAFFTISLKALEIKEVIACSDKSNTT